MGEVPDEESLAHPISTRSQLASLSVEDRRRIASWAADEVHPGPPGPRARTRRLIVVGVSVVATVLLIPWIGLLSTKLPNTFTSHQWDVAWTGFDVALVVSVAVTAWASWRSRQVVLGTLLVTATLLLCDAWFDVTLSWGTNEHASSIASALFAEIPFAILLLFLAVRLLRALLRYVWALEGRRSPIGSLFSVPILVSPASEERPGSSEGESSR